MPKRQKNAYESRADALELVDALPLDPKFEKALIDRAIRVRSNWIQSGDTTCIDRTTPELEPDQDIRPLLSNGRHLVLSDSNITVTSVGDFFGASGEITVNGTKYLIGSSKQELFLTDSTMPRLKTVISPDQLSSLLLMAIKERTEEISHRSIEVIASHIVDDQTDWERLQAIVEATGNAMGMSSRTIWGVFDDSEANDVIVARLTELSEPTEDSVNLFLRAYEQTELFANLTNIDQTRCAPFDDDNEKIANSELSEIIPKAQFINESLPNPGLNPDDGHDGLGDRQVAEYAALCERFVWVYRQLMDKPSDIATE